jgi:hypothetical protein
MTASRSRAGARHTHGLAKLAAGIVIAAAAGLSQAEAAVVYTWHTLSATIDGIPADAGAVGEIVLTDAGFASGSVSVITDPSGGTPSDPFQHTLNGVVSASFGAFGGPTISAPGFDIVNFTATVSGSFLDVGSWFFANYGETEQYFGESGPGPHVLTIGFGTDNGESVCWGPAQPGQSRCVVTGFFQQVAVPEPGSLAILAAAFSAFGALGFARRQTKQKIG